MVMLIFFGGCGKMEKKETFKVLDIIYQKGTFENIQGMPGNEAGRIIKKGDTTIENIGNGQGTKITSSNLHVVVDNNGIHETINIAHQYHKEISHRITKKGLENMKEKLIGKIFEKNKGEAITDSIINALKTR